MRVASICPCMGTAHFPVPFLHTISGAGIQPPAVENTILVGSTVAKYMYECMYVLCMEWDKEEKTIKLTYSLNSRFYYANILYKLCSAFLLCIFSFILSCC